MTRRKNGAQLQAILDQLYESYVGQYHHSPGDFFIKRQDPLAFAHRYSRFEDVEAAAFLAATFAYGRVQSLCSFVERLLALLQPSPYKFLSRGPDAVDTLIPRAPYYRLQKSDEILNLLRMLAMVYTAHGSLYALFLESYDTHNTISTNIGGFVRRLYTIHGSPIPFLLPLPDSGSPCKRLNLFFRWMVRNDGIDLGLWEKVSPSRLIIPLDTHIGKVSYQLGWIDTPSLSWKKAERITAILRKFNPEDPVRYDFSLCHESIERSALLQEIVQGRRDSKRARLYKE